MTVITNWDLQGRVYKGLAGLGRPATRTEVHAYGYPCLNNRKSVDIQVALDELVALGWVRRFKRAGPVCHGRPAVRKWTYYAMAGKSRYTHG